MVYTISKFKISKSDPMVKEISKLATIFYSFIHCNICKQYLIFHDVLIFLFNVFQNPVATFLKRSASSLLGNINSNKGSAMSN